MLLQVYDTRGKLKANYKHGLKQEGSNAIRFENQNLESGIYFYTLLSENESFSGKDAYAVISAEAQFTYLRHRVRTLIWKFKTYTRIRNSIFLLMNLMK